MDRDDLLALFDREQRREVVYNDSIREECPNLVRHRPRVGGFGFIVYSRLGETDADGVIAAQIDYFRSLNCPFEWKVYSHDTPADLGKRLSRHGFVKDERESVMVLDLAQAPALLDVRPNSNDIRKIVTPDGVDHVLAVETAVWQRDYTALGDRLRLDLIETPDELSIYVAYMDGAPVSTAWIYVHPGTSFASLWGGSTLESWRGRGLYTALLAVRATEAHDRGYRFLTVDAGDMSRPILEQHGFTHLTDTYAFKWTPDEESTEPRRDK